MSNAGCCFCDELTSGTFEMGGQLFPLLRRRIVMDRNDFVVFPTLSPLSAGHVLIIPKVHVTSLAQLSSSQREGLLEVYEHAVGRIGTIFGETLFFEHGVGSGLGGCGVTHAHLHIIPASLSTTLSEVSAQYQLEGPAGLGQVLNRFCPGSSYLLLGGSPEKVFSVEAKIPSQFMRKLLARRKGLNSWDWRLAGQWEFFSETMALFSEPLR